MAMNRLKNQKGAALMMALASMTLLIIIAMDIMYESTVETVASQHSLDQLKARYAAKAGAQVALLRIQIFRKVSATVSNMTAGANAPAGGGFDKSILDLIWQFPLAWPPKLPKDVTIADKDSFTTAMKDTLMKGEYFMTIDSEGSKIDINDLDSKSKVVREAVRKQLKQIFQNKVENDDLFARRYSSFDIDRLLNNIQDWVDANTEGISGGAESSEYPDVSSEFVPANQPFKTIGELHQVARMTDELYDLFAPQVTVYGVKGINVNYASKEILMSLHTGILSEQADQIIERVRDSKDGPFKDLADFENFLEQKIGIRDKPFSNNPELKNYLMFDPEVNFRVRVTGKSGAIQRDINAVVYDIDTVSNRLSEFIKNENPPSRAAGAGGATTGANPPPQPGGAAAGASAGGSAAAGASTPKPPPPKGKPNVVFWFES